MAAAVGAATAVPIAAAVGGVNAVTVPEAIPTVGGFETIAEAIADAEGEPPTVGGLATMAAAMAEADGAATAVPIAAAVGGVKDVMLPDDKETVGGLATIAEATAAADGGGAAAIVTRDASAAKSLTSVFPFTSNSIGEMSPSDKVGGVALYCPLLNGVLLIIFLFR